MKNYENIVTFMDNYAKSLIEDAKKHNESSVLLSYEFGMKDALNNAFDTVTIQYNEDAGLIDDAMLYIANNLEKNGLSVDFDSIEDLNIAVRL